MVHLGVQVDPDFQSGQKLITMIDMWLIEFIIFHRVTRLFNLLHVLTEYVPK